MAQFLTAKDVAYDRPGSVAGYYGWNANSIDDVISSALGGPAKNARNIRQSLDKYLGKRGASLDSASPSQRIAAMDYAYREEGRKQQTKGSGFLDFLEKAIGPVASALVLGPVGAGLTSAAVGGAVGGAIQGGVSDGPLGAALGGLGGYGIGSGVGKLTGWAQNALSPANAAWTTKPAAGFDAWSAGDWAPAGTPAWNAGGAWTPGAAWTRGPEAGFDAWTPGDWGPIGTPAWGGTSPNSLLDNASKVPIPGGMAPQGAAQGPTAPAAENAGVSLAGSAEAPRPTPTAGSVVQPQQFDATLLNAAGKMPANALAMTGMGRGGVGLTERDMYRNPGYQPRPVANFLMV